MGAKSIVRVDIVLIILAMNLVANDLLFFNRYLYLRCKNIDINKPLTLITVQMPWTTYEIWMRLCSN